MFSNVHYHFEELHQATITNHFLPTNTRAHNKKTLQIKTAAHPKLDTFSKIVNYRLALEKKLKFIVLLLFCLHMRFIFDNRPGRGGGATQPLSDRYVPPAS